MRKGKYLAGILLAGFVLLAGTARAEGDKAPPEAAPATHASLRAALLYDGFAVEDGTQARAFDKPRNVALALGMSAVVPGLGQAYNRNWIKAGLSAAIEVGLIAGYAVWRADGLSGRDAYIAEAHQFWNPSQYADWLNDYTRFLEQQHNANISAAEIMLPSGIDFQQPGSWSADEQRAVRNFFDQIRAVEGQVFHPETGASFSHKLPYFAEQQYYELIGKYFQFAPGWEDYPAWLDANGDFTVAIDPERTGAGGSKPNVSGRFWQYADDHREANTLLRRASRVSAFLVINHVLSAFDAAISAKLHNNRLNTRVDLAYDALGQPQPVATLSLTF